MLKQLLAVLCAATGGLLFVSPASALTLYGTNGNDHLDGTSSADFIYYLAGNDHGNAFGGSDEIYGMEGDDWELGGGDGGDYIEGGWGDDSVLGANGNDNLAAGCNPGCASGGDYVGGAYGDDQLRAKNGVVDSGSGGPGYDVCWKDSFDTFNDCEVIN